MKVLIASVITVILKFIITFINYEQVAIFTRLSSKTPRTYLISYEKRNKKFYKPFMIFWK